MHVPRMLPRAAAERAFAEFVLIVLGVLVALWVNELNQARVDRRRERVDLVQLLAATRDNEQRVQDALARDRAAYQASTRLLAALASDAPLPPSDSMSAWRQQAFTFSVFFPMMGAYDALAQTGELNLVRNDSLRARIAEYGGILAGTRDQLDNWTGTFHRNVADVIRTLPEPRIRDIVAQRSPPAESWRMPDLERGLYLQSIISRNRVLNLEDLLAATRALREALERELGSSPGAPAPATLERKE